jgi:nicotinamidase-related amidase
MTTLENRPNTALLVVDVQNGVVEGAHERDAVVANVGSLVEKARRERVPVVWVQLSDEQLAKGSDDWRIVPELSPDVAEPRVEKHYGDSFEDTILETLLSGLGVGRLVVVAAGPGHRAHEPVLDLPVGTGTDGGDGRDQGCRLRRHVLKPP